MPVTKKENVWMCVDWLTDPQCIYYNILLYTLWTDLPTFMTVCKRKYSLGLTGAALVCPPPSTRREREREVSLTQMDREGKGGGVR